MVCSLWLPDDGENHPDEMVVEARLKIIHHTGDKLHPAFVEWRPTAGG